jgi:hypothetical protein
MHLRCRPDCPHYSANLAKYLVKYSAGRVKVFAIATNSAFAA